MEDVHKDHCPSLDSTTSATPLGGRSVRLCVVPSDSPALQPQAVKSEGPGLKIAGGSSHAREVLARQQQSPHSAMTTAMLFLSLIAAACS